MAALFYPKSIKVIICYSNNRPPPHATLLNSRAPGFYFFPLSFLPTPPPPPPSSFHLFYRLESAIYVLQFNLTSGRPLTRLPKPLRWLQPRLRGY